ncbi:MAG TPA: NAD(P)-dependent oxidoreductase [Candidatus Dormibacteraeota bacterium]|nr:NAD(P)-dependent oxidoreductase [Candidatus Dormibacteraeota bacterium]
MKRIVVTGGSGKIGAWVLKELLDEGHEVLNVDLKPAADPRCRTLIADLTDSGQAYGAIGVYTGIDELQPSLRPQPIDALVHFAAIPRVQLVPDAEVFRINTTSTYNVMEAAIRAGIRKIVYASSEAAYGIDFADDHLDPDYFPIDEEHPTVPMDAYGLSKVANERTAAAFHARVGGDFYGLRIGDVMAPQDYAKFPVWTTDPAIRKRELWAYVDIRDVAQMVRLCVSTDGLGFQVFNAFAGESAHVTPIRELAGRFYPKVPMKAEISEHGSLVSNSKARRMLGFEQKHRWTEQSQG